MNRLQRRRTARTLTGRHTAVVHRVAALLLEYPTEELVALLPTLRAAVDELDGPARDCLAGMVADLAAMPLPQAQARYVETFDLRRRCSLYLTYYAYGDTRRRGLALVQVKQAFRDAGWELAGDELADHLAVVLELASAPGGQETGLRLLLEHRAGVELLRLALADAGSPYAGVLAAVSATLPPLEGDEREAVARLAAEGPPGEDVGLEPFGPLTPPAVAPQAGPIPVTLTGARP